MLHAFLSDRMVTPSGTRPGALLVEGERIVGVANEAELPAGATVHDHRRQAILPGLVDTHVHINEPGRTEWEGFRTATGAAAAGGYTLLVDMPLNCLPETTTVENLEAKRSAAKGQCLVDWAAWGGVVADNQLDILPLAAAGVPGFKCFLIYPGCEGFTMVDLQQLEAALPFVAETGLPLLVHAELAGPIDRATGNLRDADWTRYSTYLASRPDAAELEAIEMLIRLCRRHRFRLHIVHLSTAEALPLLTAARDEGLPITVETCPHYLHFAAEHIPDGATLHKCAPPIRSEANRERLWQAAGTGSIDLIATDHSPCPPSMKGLEHGRWDKAWGGIASLSIALPVVHTGARRRGYTLADLARWLCAGPAALAGWADRAGALLPGREANFVIFDPDASFTVTADELHFRHAVSPYVGETLTGRVHATYLRGEAVYADGLFAALPRGREVRAGKLDQNT
jgi:allantoinase